MLANGEQGGIREQMPVGQGLLADSGRFRDMEGRERVLLALEDGFRRIGARHVLATGLPLPDRAVEPLAFVADWGEIRADRLHERRIDPRDPILIHALTASRPFFWNPRSERSGDDSSLVRMLPDVDAGGLIGIPVDGFAPYQACVFAAGSTMIADRRILLSLDVFCHEAFHRLITLGALKTSRPGDLSERERRVLTLSAAGKTAGEIADLLEISQRTVHAHLQNASAKLRAGNKTHTVVEALRYRQIAL